MKDSRILLARFDLANHTISKQTVVAEANWNTHIDIHVWRDALWLVHHDVDVTKEHDLEFATEATLRLMKIEEVSNRAGD